MNISIIKNTILPIFLRIFLFMSLNDWFNLARPFGKSCVHHWLIVLLLQVITCNATKDYNFEKFPMYVF